MADVFFSHLLCTQSKFFFEIKKKFFGENDDMLSVVNVLRLNFFSFIHFGGHFDQLMILLVLMMCSICMWWIDCRFSLPKIICSNKEKFNSIRFDQQYTGDYNHVVFLLLLSLLHISQSEKKILLFFLVAYCTHTHTKNFNFYV